MIKVINVSPLEVLCYLCGHSILWTECDPRKVLQESMDWHCVLTRWNFFPQTFYLRRGESFWQYVILDFIEALSCQCFFIKTSCFKELQNIFSWCEYLSHGPFQFIYPITLGTYINLILRKSAYWKNWPSLA